MSKHLDDSAGTRRPDAGKPAARRRAQRRAIQVLYHDPAILIVDKPAGVWLDGAGGEGPSVREHLVARGIIAEGDDLHLVYPLDQDASGVLAITRSASLTESLQGQMADGALDLCTLAIVRGPVAQDTGTLERRIAQRDPAGLAHIDEPNGTEAVTQWRLRDSFVGFALLECRPRTAVQHQIRAHLEAAGMPLAVDPAYGGANHLMLSSFKAGYHPSRRRPERPLIRRLTLHAANVTFEHPTTGKHLQFEAPPPKDFRATLHQLAKYARLPPT